jgi:hypothetical protein
MLPLLPPLLRLQLQALRHHVIDVCVVAHHQQSYMLPNQMSREEHGLVPVEVAAGRYWMDVEEAWECWLAED